MKNTVWSSTWIAFLHVSWTLSALSNTVVANWRWRASSYHLWEIWGDLHELLLNLRSVVLWPVSLICGKHAKVIRMKEWKTSWFRSCTYLVVVGELNQTAWGCHSDIERELLQTVGYRLCSPTFTSSNLLLLRCTSADTDGVTSLNKGKVIVQRKMCEWQLRDSFCEHLEGAICWSPETNPDSAGSQ